MSKLRLGILISGRGSNMAAILTEIKAGRVDAEAVIVISNNPDAPGLATAQQYDVDTMVVSSKTAKDTRSYEGQIIDALNQKKVDLVVLAGYMKLISPEFCAAYAGRIINIHPSLLPSFKGLDAQKQAIDYGVKVSGCTVHYVTEKMDAGPIILQTPVTVLESDTAETLQARILDQEHQLLPRAIQLIAEGKVSIKGRKVSIQEGVRL